MPTQSPGPYYLHTILESVGPVTESVLLDHRIYPLRDLNVNRYDRLALHTICTTQGTGTFTLPSLFFTYGSVQIRELGTAVAQYGTVVVSEKVTNWN